MAQDARVDAYIERQQPFARPILHELRARVHAACPDAEEAIKWGMPAFMYRGRLLAGMAAFKAHATFSFWDNTVTVRSPEGGMGNFGKLRTLADLPALDTHAALIAEAAARIDAGAKPARPAREWQSERKPPADLVAALSGAGAEAAFAALPPGARREYLEWIESAKRSDTRAKRVATTVTQAREGKRLHWRYEG